MKVAYGSYANIETRGQISNYSGTQAVGTMNAAPNVNNSTFPLVNLHVSASKLKDMDVITVSDPICVLFIQDQGQWKEFSRTEVIWNNLNPEWVTFFTIMYVFEIRQPICFRVYDVDSADADLNKQNLIGEAITELSQIIANTGGLTMELKVTGRTDFRGTITVTPEQVENCASVVQGRINALRLKKLHLIWGNDPFFIISKAAEAGRYLPIYQSEVNKKLRYKRFSIPYQVLCNVDPDRPIRISFHDYRAHKNALLIGYHDTTFARLSEQLGQVLQLTNERNENCGQFRFEELNLQQHYNFYDYLHGGVQLNLITAIDFTASNRDPRDVHSLHYISPGGDNINAYQRCIRAVGEILCPYDSDQLFPVLGFGAKVAGQIQHCFPLTFNPQAPCVQGLNGILDVYQNALTQVQLSGPTLFSHVIRYSTQLAVESWRESRTYTILLIITDGIINDMPDTIDAIVDAGRLPLSIIIVGVGDADFSAMDVLDADDVPLVSRRGQTMERDLVQFVPFNKFARSHYSVLASEVLEEIPRQLVEWAEMNGVRPTH